MHSRTLPHRFQIFRPRCSLCSVSSKYFREMIKKDQYKYKIRTFPVTIVDGAGGGHFQKFGFFPNIPVYYNHPSPKIYDFRFTIILSDLLKIFPILLSSCTFWSDFDPFLRFPHLPLYHNTLNLQFTNLSEKSTPCLSPPPTITVRRVP